MSAHSTVTGSDVVLTTPYFSVRRDALRYPGGESGTYYVMEKPAFAAAVVFDADGRICLVNCYRYPIDTRRWELPQGSGPEGEDLDVVVRDELVQEAGVVAGELDTLCVLHEAYGYATTRCVVYTGRHLRTVEQCPEVSEGSIDVGWFSEREFWQMVRDGDITDAVTIAAVGTAVRGGTDGD